MARREFTKEVRRLALTRAAYVCEGVNEEGVRCTIAVGRGSPVEFDHVLSDWMGGEPTLENCAALCRTCHKIKTALDAAARAQAVRRRDRHDGITAPGRRLVSRGFPKPPKKHPATARVEKLYEFRDRS